MKKVMFAASLFAAALCARADFHEWAKTPPMGWNSWDCYGSIVNEAEFKANVDVLAERLKPFGYEYAVCDIRWTVQNEWLTGYNQENPVYTLDEWGRYLPAPSRFPSAAKGAGFKPIADYVHSKGLKFGIHIMRGVPKEAVARKLPVKGVEGVTCDMVTNGKVECFWLKDNCTVLAGVKGAQEYYDSIFELYASWGVDFVKVDDLSAPGYHKDEVEMIRRAIDKCGRPMVFSTSPGETPINENAHLQANANMWRVVNDVWDSWGHIEHLVPIMCKWLEKDAVQGSWPDCDMIPFGMLGVKGHYWSVGAKARGRKCALTADEQRTLMNFFAITRSPLMVGADLPQLDDATFSLLTDKTILAAQRDGRNPKPIFCTKDACAIASDNGKGGKFLALFNLKNEEAEVGALGAKRRLPPHGSALIDLSKSVTKITYYAPNIVRITKSREGVELVHLVQTVTAKPQDVKVDSRDEDGVVVYSSKSLTVRHDTKRDVVTFLAPDGKVLLAEKDPALYRDREWGGLKQVGAEQTWTLEKDEAIYGLGDNQPDRLNMRGWNALLHPRNVGDGLAAFVSVKGYGLLWDNTSPVSVRDNDYGFTFESEIGNAVDYYFVFGGSIDGSTAGFREITGDVPMLPRWAYGFWQSKERYKTQWETVDVLKKYRELGIPLDGIVQDWQYWGGNPLWNAMEFTGKDFPDPKWMVKSVHDMNARMLITIWQSFGPLTKPYRELAAKDYLFPFVTWPQSCLDQWPPRMDYPSGVKLYDNYSAEARGIYWKHLHRLYDLGIDGWWMDSTDPDHNYKEGDLEHKTSLGCTWREVRSAYPLEGTRAVYENMRKETDRRVFILTRGASLGQQRYATSVWSGDVGSSWDVLRRQIPGGLNYVVTGNPNFNCDIGGFFAGRYNNGGGVDNPNWRELYVRWMQLGTFLPMMRSHGTDIPREVYLYGKGGEPVYDALVGAIRLRYRLMPYIYTLGANATQRREGVMRPVASDFPQDSKTWNLLHQFLLGKSILAAPVLDAKYTREDNKPVGEMEGWNGEQGTGNGEQNGERRGINWAAERTHRAYLPAGADWWCFETAKKFAGGQTVEFPTTLASQPFFVRAGSVLPLGPDVQYNGEKAWDDLEVRVYPGADGEGELYEDDFDTYACEKGAFTRIAFKWDDKSRTLTIGKRQGEYPGMLKSRTFRIVLPDGTSRLVSYNGEKAEVSFP